jgi:hypothetical protein
MPHPVLEEIVRARPPIRDDVFRRWQQAIQRELLTPDGKDPKPPKKASDQ